MGLEVHGVNVNRWLARRAIALAAQMSDSRTTYFESNFGLDNECGWELVAIYLYAAWFVIIVASIVLYTALVITQDLLPGWCGGVIDSVGAFGLSFPICCGFSAECGINRRKRRHDPLRPVQDPLRRSDLLRTESRVGMVLALVVGTVLRLTTFR